MSKFKVSTKVTKRKLVHVIKRMHDVANAPIMAEPFGSLSALAMNLDSFANHVQGFKRSYASQVFMERNRVKKQSEEIKMLRKVIRSLASSAGTDYSSQLLDRIQLTLMEAGFDFESTQDSAVDDSE